MEGVWSNNTLSGECKFHLTTGFVVEGTWDDNKLQQVKYNCKAVAGKRTGDGVESDAIGLVKYKGEWKNDKYSGKGTLYNETAG
jgi:hypothetical protein